MFCSLQELCLHLITDKNHFSICGLNICPELGENKNVTSWNGQLCISKIYIKALNTPLSGCIRFRPDLHDVKVFMRLNCKGNVDILNRAAVVGKLKAIWFP